jgi:hypothetical protein
MGTGGKNDRWARLFFDAILSVGRGVPVDDPEAVALPA